MRGRAGSTPMRSFLACGALALALSVAGGCARPAAMPAPDFAADTTTGVFVFRVEGDRLVAEVRSERGIGDAVIRQTQGNRPNSLEMRVFLKGLEELNFSYANVETSVSISSSGDGRVRQEVALDGEAAREIDPQSPYWLPVEIVAEDKTIPLGDGYFRVEASRDFLASSPGSPLAFKVSWIDFYR